jgi:hypothetical protein
MKFLNQSYIGISSFKQDIYFNKWILPIAIASLTADWPVLSPSSTPICLDDLYLLGLSETATFFPRFAKSGTIARHLDHKQDHCPTNKAKHFFPRGPTGRMFCHDSLNNRINFSSWNVVSPVPRSPPTSAHLPNSLFTMVYKLAWPSTLPPGRNFLNLLGGDCPSFRGLICRATSFSHLIFSLPHQIFPSQTQVEKKPIHINMVVSTIAILLINSKQPPPTAHLPIRFA